ncbi:terminase large subunit domain-containing protein [Rhodococcus daqingensis]|uniref:Terminase large subunit domain-containing protein n=1 Tax=Rhodococcus daqingensis TaxID=2479363 RepID=A0ABW2S2Z5_9NOCA
MTALEWMPWQLDAIAQSESAPEFAISAPRQAGKSAVGLEVARRAAARGENIVYFTASSALALNALDRITAAQRALDPSLIRRITRSSVVRSITIGAGTIDFCSYRSTRQPARGRDRIICDDHTGQPLGYERLITSGPLLRLGVQLEPGTPGTPMLRFGMDEGDDPYAEDTLRKANPGIGTTTTIDRLRCTAASATLDAWKAEILNAPLP